MQGDLHSEQHSGMIPRAVRHLFQRIEQLQCKDWQYTCKAMFVEIYNEKLMDLLDENQSDERDEIKIMHRKNGTTSVQGMVVCEVESAADVFPLLQRAEINRSVEKTALNDFSSRSHSVFQLELNGVNAISGQQTFGVLNLIDLAGSERLKASKSQGERLKETQTINKSLSCLGNVIAAIASGEKHIPYRDSKLTYLLQNCFGDASKCLMFVNLSPEEEHAHESLCSLRFASKVNSCQIGSARRKMSVF
jgi:kinesin family protein C1